MSSKVRRTTIQRAPSCCGVASGCAGVGARPLTPLTTMRRGASCRAQVAAGNVLHGAGEPLRAGHGAAAAAVEDFGPGRAHDSSSPCPSCLAPACLPPPRLRPARPTATRTACSPPPVSLGGGRFSATTSKTRRSTSQSRATSGGTECWRPLSSSASVRQLSSRPRLLRQRESRVVLPPAPPRPAAVRVTAAPCIAFLSRDRGAWGRQLPVWDIRCGPADLSSSRCLHPPRWRPEVSDVEAPARTPACVWRHLIRDRCSLLPRSKE